MRTYTLELRDDQCRETRKISARNISHAVTIASAKAVDWVHGGEWGIHGGECGISRASIRVRWTLTNSRGIVDEGYEDVEIDPGEYDTVEYEQPESWCADCEQYECIC